MNRKMTFTVGLLTVLTMVFGLPLNAKAPKGNRGAKADETPQPALVVKLKNGGTHTYYLSKQLYSTHQKDSLLLYGEDVEVSYNFKELSSYSFAMAIGGDVVVPDKVATPEFQPKGGSFYDSVRVSIHCETPGSGIYYRLTDDDAFSPYTGPILLTDTTKVSAYAAASDMANSDTLSCMFYVKAQLDANQVKVPQISPEGGLYLDSVEVSISCVTADAEIYYSTDGGAPRIYYQKPFMLRKDALVKAYAEKAGMTASDTVEMHYEVKNTAPSANLTEEGAKLVFRFLDNNRIEVTGADRIEVFNLNGHILQTKYARSRETVQLKLQNLPAGVYLLRACTDNDQACKTLKFFRK